MLTEMIESHGPPAILMAVLGLVANSWALFSLFSLFKNPTRGRALRNGAFCLMAVAMVLGMAWAAMLPQPAGGQKVLAGNVVLVTLGLGLSLLPFLAGVACLLNGLLLAPETPAVGRAWPAWVGGFGLAAGLLMGLWAMAGWLEFGVFRIAILFGF
jgi:hypothetical protein